MKQSILNGKAILAVGGGRDIYPTLDAEINGKCDRYRLEAAGTYKEASLLMTCWTYDLIVLDADCDRSTKLLEEARWRRFPVVMLTSGAMTVERLRELLEMGARSYLPKDCQNGELASFLEDALTYQCQSMWKRFLRGLGSCFNGNGKPKRLKSEKQLWKEFNQKSRIAMPTIVQ